MVHGAYLRVHAFRYLGNFLGARLLKGERCKEPTRVKYFYPQKLGDTDFDIVATDLVKEVATPAEIAKGRRTFYEFKE